MENNSKSEACLKDNGHSFEEMTMEKNEAKWWDNLFNRRNIFIAFYLICLAGCTYQMIEVLVLYFKYKTVTTLKIERSTTITPPSVSICFPYISLVNLTLLFEKHPHLMPIALNITKQSGENIDFNNHRIKNFKKKRGKFDWEFGVEIERQLSIREMLDVTVTIDQLFIQFVAKSPDTYVAEELLSLEESRKIWNIDYYVKDESKCFLFEYKSVASRKNVYNLEKLANSYSFRTLLSSFRFKTDVLTSGVEKAFLYFHPLNRLPRGRIDSLLTFKYPAKNVSYSTSYSRILTKLLPYPYESDCRDYSKSGYESREHCVEECIENRAQAIYGRVPYTMVFLKDSNLKIIGFKELELNATLAKELQHIHEKCDLLCKKPDCVKEYFKPDLLATEDGTQLKFSVDIPSSLDIKTKLSPKLTFLEYVIYNTSVFGFWFGLCVLQLADFIEYLRKKRKLAKKILRRKPATRL